MRAENARLQDALKHVNALVKAAQEYWLAMGMRSDLAKSNASTALLEALKPFEQEAGRG
jgi:hypothetical protein